METSTCAWNLATNDALWSKKPGIQTSFDMVHEGNMESMLNTGANGYVGEINSETIEESWDY